MRFSKYNHFMNYILKIMDNKKLKLDDLEYEIMQEFEIVYNKLMKLEKLQIININEPILESIISIGFKDGFHIMFEFMKIAISQAKKACNELDLYYLICFFHNRNIHIEFVEAFIKKENMKIKGFPSKVKILKICKKQKKLFDFDYIFTKYSDNFRNKVGIYFIYNQDNNIVYIGKSTNCVLNRSLNSVKERRLYDFLKIEYRILNSKSDIAVYESYYIAKYKPVKNKDMVFSDALTVELPDLVVSKSIKGIDLMIEYEYYLEKTVDVEEFLNSDEKDKMFLHSKKNKEYLEKKLAIYNSRQAYENLFDKENIKKMIKEIINN